MLALAGEPLVSHESHCCSQNNPLYLRTFGEPSGDPSSILRFHFIVHAALDHVEEKSTPPYRSWPYNLQHSMLSRTVPHLSLPVSIQRQSAVSSGTISAKLDMYLGFLYPIEEYRVCVLRRSIFLAHAQALIWAGLAANAPTVPLRPCGHAPAEMATATRLVPRPPSFRAGTAM